MTAQDILQIITASACIQCICDIGAHYFVYRTESYHILLDKLSTSQSKLNNARNKLKIEEEGTATSDVQNSTPNSSTKTKGAKEKSVAATNSKKSLEKQQQLVKRLEEEHNTHLSAVALEHFRPFAVTSVFFLLLMKILGTEHKQKIIAILPFVPYRWIQRILSLRGLQISSHWFDVNNIDNTSILLKELLSNVNNTYYTTITEDDTADKVSSSSITSIGQICSFTFIYMLTNMSVKYYINQLLSTSPPHGAESYITTMMDAPKTQALVQKTTGIDPKTLKAE